MPTKVGVLERKRGQMVQVRLKEGEIIKGYVTEETGSSIRLTDAYITLEDPDTGEPDDVWAPCLVEIEIPYIDMESLRILSNGS